MLPFENVLEIILAFDKEGMIVYGNAAAREKLGYDQGLEGLFVGAVFPGAFQKDGGGWKAVYPFGMKTHRTTAYRKNQTCFPTDMRVLVQEQSDGSPANQEGSSVTPVTVGRQMIGTAKSTNPA